MAVNGKICSNVFMFLERCVHKACTRLPQELNETACSNRAVQKFSVVVYPCVHVPPAESA